MPSTTPKSRPVARSYSSNPGLRQQRFDSRRQSLKGSHVALPKTPLSEARRQNTLTQMDFVRLNSRFALEDDDLSYLEYEPVMKSEVKSESILEDSHGQVTEETDNEAPNTRKRKRTTKGKGDKRIKYEMGSIEEPSAATPRMSKRVRDDIGLQSSKPSNLSAALDGKTKPTWELAKEFEKRAPLRPKPTNPKIRERLGQPDEHVKKATIFSASEEASINELQLKKAGNIKSEHQISQPPDEAETLGASLLKESTRILQLPTQSSDDLGEGKKRDPSRFSDPGMSIPDSEDEGETQAMVPSPTKAPIPRLPSQKSFSQATTVDGTQPTPNTQPIQSSTSPSKSATSPSGTNTVSRCAADPELWPPPPSSLNSDTSNVGLNHAYPVTESQLLPSSVMNFELPRLPGWSQNSDDVEEIIEEEPHEL